MEEKLKEYGLEIHYNDAENADPVDFNIADKEDNVATVWGQTLDDVEYECNHPHECIEFGDKDEQGECLLCGNYCDWHYEEDDEGHKIPEPHEWYFDRNVGGMIKQYLKELKDKWLAE